MYIWLLAYPTGHNYRRIKRDNMEKQKIWFITGTSRGFGLALTKHLLSQGNKVVATSRDISALQSIAAEHHEHFLPLQVDLTSDQAVKEAVDFAIQHFGGLDVVVNNAGYALAGAVEEISDAEWKSSMDVNFFAAVHVLRHSIPHLRARGAGHILNISSIAGYSGIALASSYNAAKFALVGLSEGLAKELAPFGIKLTLIAPGEFRTSFMDSGSMQYANTRIPAYGLDQFEQECLQYSGQQPGDPQKLVAIIADLVQQEQPPQRLLLGADAYQLYEAQQKEEEAQIHQWKAITLSTDLDASTS